MNWLSVGLGVVLCAVIGCKKESTRQPTAAEIPVALVAPEPAPPVEPAPSARAPADAAAAPAAAAEGKKRVRDRDRDKEIAQQIEILLADTGDGDAVTMHELDTGSDLGLADLAKGPDRAPAAAKPDGAPATAKLRGRLSVGSVKLFDASSLTQADVQRRINSVYRRGLLRCYERRLKVDPEFEADAKAMFTVGETGRATGARVTLSPAESSVSDCMAALIGTWRFAIPKDADDEPSEVDVMAVMKLAPSR